MDQRKQIIFAGALSGIVLGILLSIIIDSAIFSLILAGTMGFLWNGFNQAFSTENETGQRQL